MNIYICSSVAGFKARKVTNPMLWRRLLLLCAFDFIILGLSVAFKWTEYEHEVDLRGGAHYSVCISDSHVGTVVSLLFKMALVAWGVRLSYGIESLPTPSTSESRGIREATILAGIGCVAYMVIWTLGILDGKYGGLVRGALVCSVAGFGGGRMFKKNGAAAEEEAAASFSTTRLTTARLTTAKFTTTRCDRANMSSLFCYFESNLSLRSSQAHQRSFHDAYSANIFEVRGCPLRSVREAEQSEQLEGGCLRGV